METGAVSLEVFARLGGASRQAVHGSGDPVRWLAARVRRGLLPVRPESVRGAHQVARARAAAVVESARGRMGARGEVRGTGRRRAESAGELGRLLGVVVRAGETVVEVFGRWVAEQVRAVGRLGRGRRPRGWRAVVPWLDAVWLPRWVGRPCGAWAVVPEGRRFVSERVAEGSREEEAYDSPWGEEESLLYEID